jgi:hypothetical protein
MNSANNRKGRSTPRIVRAIRRNSKKRKFPSSVRTAKFWTKGNFLLHCSTSSLEKSIHSRLGFSVDSTGDRSLTTDRPRTGNSKSSVVVLYHGRSSTPPSSSSKVPVQLTKSDQTITETSHPVTSSVLPDK